MRDPVGRGEARTVDVTEPWSAGPIEPVPRPVMRHRWCDIAFLHWSFEPGVVAPLVPSSLDVETFEGAAWVGLTPFRLADVRGPWGPSVPWLSWSPETNVRTYVRDRRGRSGVWFLSLDIARAPVAVAARVGWRLPYMWSRLGVERAGTRMRYTGRRRVGGPPGSYDVVVDIGDAVGAGDVTTFDRFLTARFALFACYGRMLARTRVAHAPWPLRRATPVRVRETWLRAAGLPYPAGPPVVHWSPGVSVRIALPDRAARG